MAPKPSPPSCPIRPSASAAIPRPARRANVHASARRMAALTTFSRLYHVVTVMSTNVAMVARTPPAHTRSCWLVNSPMDRVAITEPATRTYVTTKRPRGVRPKRRASAYRDVTSGQTGARCVLRSHAYGCTHDGECAEKYGKGCDPCASEALPIEYRAISRRAKVCQASVPLPEVISFRVRRKSRARPTRPVCP